jgi:hypothetical protein
VYIKEVEAGSRPIEGVGTAVAAFVGLAARGPVNSPTLVTNWTQYTDKFGDFMENAYLAHAVYGYFLNGGGACYVVRVGADGTMPAAQGQLVSAKDESKPVYRITALEPGLGGNDVTVDIQPSSETSASTFKLVVTQGAQTEVFDDLSPGRSRTGVLARVKSSKLIQIEEVGNATAAERLPAFGTVTLTGGASSVAMRVTPDDYVGKAADRTGFAGLEAVDDVTMLCVPDLMAVYQQGILDLEGVQAVQGAMISHAELMGDRVAVLDAPPSLDAQQVKQWRVDKAGYDSKYAALYWPWIKVFDPVSGQTVPIPPSGHVAGIWARNDDTRGVHKAPANEVVRGAISLELNLTKGEHDTLNPAGINCIRAFPGRGIRVWGARTLSSDDAWRYVNVRRLFNFVEESIFEGTQWVVFEPNDQRLWGRVKRTINSFLLRIWRDGALFGATPEQAFFVKCDEENNPAEVRDAGQLIVDVGIAPVKPAEFVVFRIAQFSGGATVAE